MTLVFEWTALSRSGFRRAGTLRVPSARACAAALEQERLWPLTVRLNVRASLRQAFTRRPRPAAIAESFRYVADLLALGLPLDKVLEDGATTAREAGLAEAFRQAIGRIRRGERLSRALRDTGAFPAVVVSTVYAAENTGTLAKALGDIAEAASREAELRERIRSAVSYPAFVGGLGLVIGGFISLVILPRITQALEGLTTLPAVTRGFLTLGELVQPVALGGLALLGAGAAALALWHRRHPVAIWELLWRIPLVGSALRDALLARFLTNVAVFLRNGFPTLEALDGGRHGLRNAALNHAVDTVSAQIRKGKPLGQAFRHPFFPPLIAMAAARGEQTGKTEHYLDEAAGVLTREMMRRLTQLTTWLERLMLLAVAGFLLFMALALILPIYGGLQQISPYK